MRIQEFLQQLRELGIDLRAQGEKLICTATRGALTPELGREIRDRKSEILRFLGQGEALRGADRPPLRRLDHKGPYPLSYSQQRVWFIEQLGGPSALYNGPAAFRLRGQFQLEAMRASIQEIIRRHDIMRTSIELRDGEPFQVVSDSATIEIPLHAMGGEPDPLSAAMRYLAERTRIPFELGKAPLFRAELIELSTEDHVLFFMPHHIIWDGWSFDVFLSELKVIYEAFSAGKPSPLPVPAIQYADFTVWQRNWLEGGELERQLSYWRERLAGELPRLELNTDFERPLRRSSQGGRVIRVVPQEIADRLTQLARQEGATLYMALLAAYKILLSRYTGQVDILIGAPMAGNSASETERMVGFFVNTIVLRTDLSGDPSYREVLRRVQETCVGAFSHQDVPFEKVVEEMRPARDLSRTPLHQTEFGLQEASRRPRCFGPLKIEQLIVEQDVVGTDLIFWVKTDGDCLPLALDYGTTLFAKSTAEELLENLETLLLAALGAPDSKLGELEILSAAGQSSLVELGRGPSADSSSQCIHELIERRCAATPDATALVYRSTEVTYGDLDRRANQLARCLIARGVTAESLVGVCLERCPDMVIGLLAIHKAGGAYLPLDPTYPAGRLAQMITDSRARVVLTRRRFAALVASSGAECLFVEELEQELDQLEPTKPPVATDPRQLAYAIYTSGSTGGPKGVLVEHRNVTNFLTGMAGVIPLEDGGCWLAVTSISFDISVLEIFGALIHGFSVVIYDGFGDAAKDGEAIASLIDRHRVSHLQCTPSQARMLTFDADSRRALARLTQILVGGEALPVDLARQLRSLCGRVVNMYGPTETTVWSTCSVLGSEATSVSIGRPLANQRVYILDRRGNLVPRGVTGELFIGGAGVARGYLNRPEITAERFLDDPFAQVNGARMYRTGDLARFDLNGQLQFMGRADTQVKLRGHRIELGEIEHVLQQHESVNAAAVIVREDTPGDQRLTAYVTSATSIDLDSLREHLVRALPPFMIPAAIVVLEEFPLTPNGKLDRRALPEPRLAAQPRAYLPPSGLERIDDPNRWWWCPIWRKASFPEVKASTGTCLVFLDKLGIGAVLVERMRARGQTVTTVVSSDTFYEFGDSAYALNPGHESRGYAELASALKTAGRMPEQIVHLWMLTMGEEFRAGSTFVDRNIEHGFESLIHVARIFGPEAGSGLGLTVFANHSLAVVPGEVVLHPEKALLLGPCSVIPLEYPGIAVGLVDLDLADEAAGAAVLKTHRIAALVDTIESSLRKPLNSVLAHRAGQLHTLSYERIALPEESHAGSALVTGGTYLILGPLSNSGFAFAEFAATAGQVRLVVIDEAALPAPDQWRTWISEHGEQDPTSRAIAELREIESRGATVTTLIANIWDLDEMRAVLDRVETRHGRIRGVFHTVTPQRRRAMSNPLAVDGFSLSLTVLRTLGDLFEHRDLDFYVVSTGSDYAIAPPTGVHAVAVAAYANAWITRFTTVRGARAIGWGPWLPDSKLGDRETDDSDLVGLDASHLATRGHTRSEARVALGRWLACSGPPQVLLSSVDLDQHRARMAELATLVPSGDTRHGPRDDIELRLHALWAAALNLEGFGIQDDFFDLGGHSLIAARLFHQIRVEFGIQWPLSNLFEAPTIERSAALLRKAIGREPLLAGEAIRSSPQYRYLVPMHETADPTVRPLFLVGGQFGNVLNLRQLGRLMGGSRPVYAIQAKGLLGNELPHQSYEEMAASYLEEVRAVQPHGPYLLAGFCSGGTAVFEMAQQLVRAGESIGFLGFLDSGIPNWPLLTIQDRMRIHVARLRKTGPLYLPRWMASRARLEVQRVASWFAAPAKLGPAEYQHGKMRQAFLKQTADYRPHRFPGAATLLRPPLDRRYQLGNGRWSNEDYMILLPDNGWSPYVESLEILEVGGDHDHMILEPHVRHLIAALKLRLDRVEASTVEPAARSGLSTVAR